VLDNSVKMNNFLRVGKHSTQMKVDYNFHVAFFGVLSQCRIWRGCQSRPRTFCLYLQVRLEDNSILHLFT